MLIVKQRGARLTILLTLLVAMLGMCGGCMLKPGAQTELEYALPTTLTIAMGETLPGTDIRYMRTDDDGAYILIKGQEALRRVGDSVDWQGQLRTEQQTGVDVDLSLRVVSFDETQVRLAGVANIKLTGISPTTSDIVETSAIKYSGPIAYNLGKGATIPGTTITYEGTTEDGAELGGLDGYPYRKAGDSILWEGTPRKDVYARVSMRVVQFDDRALRVAGVVTLWLGY